MGRSFERRRRSQTRAEGAPFALPRLNRRAAAATAIAGTFHTIADVTAANGTAIGTTDAGLAKVATAVLILNVPTRLKNSPMNPEVPGSPTLASVKTMNTAA